MYNLYLNIYIYIYIYQIHPFSFSLFIFFLQVEDDFGKYSNMINYIFGVLTAINLTHGAAHSEIKMEDGDSRGPLLIEVIFIYFYNPSQHTTHTTKAESRAEESLRRHRHRRVARRPEIASMFFSPSLYIYIRIYVYTHTYI